MMQDPNGFCVCVLMGGRGHILGGQNVTPNYTGALEHVRCLSICMMRSGCNLEPRSDYSVCATSNVAFRAFPAPKNNEQCCDPLAFLNVDFGAAPKSQSFIA